MKNTYKWFRKNTRPCKYWNNVEFVESCTTVDDMYQKVYIMSLHCFGCHEAHYFRFKDREFVNKYPGAKR